MKDQEQDDLPLRWKKFKVVSEIFFSFLAPVVIAGIGLLLNNNISQEELKIRYIDIALDILKTPRNENQDEKIREWAVKTINKYASITMEEETKKQFEEYFSFNYGKPIPGDDTKTDFTIFTCPEKEKDSSPIIGKVIYELMREKHGEILVKIWDKYDELSSEKIQGKFTIITDKNHGEEGELPRVRKALINTNKNLPIQEVDNQNDATPWRISIIVCPN